MEVENGSLQDKFPFIYVHFHDYGRKGSIPKKSKQRFLRLLVSTPWKATILQCQLHSAYLSVLELVSP